MKKQNLGPFPLKIEKVEDYFVVVTNQGCHYAKTFDPLAAKKIQAIPDLIEALEWALNQIEDSLDPDHEAALNAALFTLAKAKGEA